MSVSGHECETNQRILGGDCGGNDGGDKNAFLVLHLYTSFIILKSQGKWTVYL